jgi:tight adherence protein B
LFRRIPSDDLDFMITAINIQHEVGGNLAEILDVIAHTIRERVRIMGEIRAITAQQRLSAAVLSLLPVGLGLAIYALNPDYVSDLWHYTCGIVMLIVGGVLIVLGYLVVRRIAAIEV